ncbi:MAG: YlmC/YmxH family sporulation protein [Clostridia bacterium]|nr:YlmC/YmxH family sporulation protein [Clostridia bacterium]
MELSFSELKKRDVVNIVDGRCYGRITDLTLSFPKGTLTGITVPGAKRNFITKCFDTNKIFIDESKILKIGNDVILVDLRRGDECGQSVKLGKQKPPAFTPPPCPPEPPCPPPCPPESPCPPPPFTKPSSTHGIFGEDDEEY